MAWFGGKVSLGSFPDLAGAVSKISESVKNIEKNFDNALGFEEKYDSSHEGLSMVDNNAISLPVNPLTGAREEGPLVAAQTEILDKEREVTKTDHLDHPKENIPCDEADSEAVKTDYEHSDANTDPIAVDIMNDDIVTNTVPSKPVVGNLNADGIYDHQFTVTANNFQSPALHQTQFKGPSASENADTVMGNANDVTVTTDATDDDSLKGEIDGSTDFHLSGIEGDMGCEGVEESCSNDMRDVRVLSSSLDSHISDHRFQHDDESIDVVKLTCDESDALENRIIEKEDNSNQDSAENELGPEKGFFHSSYEVEMEKMKMDVKMMEATLQGAAKQAQAKADEIANLMNENEQLKTANYELKKKFNEVEVESLREEYHQRVASLERKVYTLTKERDTLRREQSKKSDAAALLKEKDEIINQVMAEGEELSKKQAAQESNIRKLRAQIREIEEEKKGLHSKLQVEESKVESLNKEKAITEKLLQETVEKHKSEILSQKEQLANALTAYKEAEALAEARANSEARAELEGHLRESHEREAALLQELEELRQTLTRKEQQAVFREDMLQRDIADIQKSYQDSERRCEVLITQVPESTRPLLRQIEAIQETASRRAEAWTAVERSLNSRLQEAESKASTAEERERMLNDRLSQTQSRINVLEAQVSCFRAEQSQLNRSLEKERQRAVENRQDYLAAKEEAEIYKGRTGQLEDGVREMVRKHKEEIGAVVSQGKLLRQEVEKEKNARMELENTPKLLSSDASLLQSPVTKRWSSTENGILTRKSSNATNVEESFFLQASLASTDNFYDQRSLADVSITPLYLKTMTPTAFEAALRQKEGELALYTSRLASMQSVCDSLSEELVKMTSECEMLQAESAKFSGMKAELDTLRMRHSSALELMGERDEELEELRADIVDMKEMYREQVDLLVGKIQTLTTH